MSNEQSPGTKRPSESGRGYGYNYGGYDSYGYGYGYGGDTAAGTVQRSLSDYILILRERIWYIVVVFLVVFSSSLVYTLGETRIYQSSATVQILRRDLTPMPGVQQVSESEIRSAEDLNTQIKIIESSTLIRRVADRLKGSDLKAFLAPFERAGIPESEAAFVQNTIARNRKVVPQRLTLVVIVSYQHPDPAVAAKVANLFVEEYMKYNKGVRDADLSKAVDDLQSTVEEQRRKVDQLAHKLQAYKERNKTVSLDQRKDIVSESLKVANLEAQKAGISLQAAESRLNQIREYRAKSQDLTGLAFISESKLVQDLQQQLAARTIEISKLKERYRDGHPDMKQARKSFDQTRLELERAIASISEQVQSEYNSSLANLKARQEELGNQKTESLQLESLAVEYTQIEREYLTQNQILQGIVARKTETTMTSTFATQNARLVDQAVPSPENKPISPNVPLNLGLGVVGGLGLGLALAFFVAFIDDRVKSAYDIEGVLGLPLIGIVPEVKRLDANERATVVSSNADRQVAEAFRTLHSSLRLKDESKNAKAFLTTSTVPGEGKSFLTTNLAMTFAAHGEKVVIVDCDLRKPNVHKSLGLENSRGVIDIVSGRYSLDEVTVKNFQPNLDVVVAGGRAKNPTQILNSKGFEQLIAELRKRYDRVFIDTPPLAAVSDALIILPLVDGSLFTIFFNKVRRKAAQFSAKSLLEANVPNFGAILNGLNLAVSGYYYAQYYDKSYKDYYVSMSKGDASDGDQK
ncbi:MAG: polysaccharide biosynthesis tyrosine autokinase [Opitutaceae bacterium]|jgi:succinoglycan biosynthesis transport protein ExoP|nr:polysaccharide biosynthesis tyrosine autokinase [Opitutaceae bacterium]